MKQVKYTKYEARDGRQFDTPDAAEKHESLLDEMEIVMFEMGEAPDDPHCNFANGGGYIPHNVRHVSQAKAALLDLFNKDREDPVSDFEILGRYLDDGGSPLYQAWSRLYNCDDQGREWGQAYYAHTGLGSGTNKIYTE